jgi:hypothetical protein
MKMGYFHGNDDVGGYRTLQGAVAAPIASYFHNNGITNQ